jgi:FkbM family methyltransferase
MESLLAVKKIDSFQPLLVAYLKNGTPLRGGIDGGAGSGSTSRQMLRYMPNGGNVHAFEPFPGNHRFFTDKDDKRLVLHKLALADEPKPMKFSVPSVVQADSVWGQRGMAGYSSVGYLTDTPIKGAQVYTVDCARADDIIGADDPVDFVKLDLQGGELNALKGMPRILSQVRLMWVEFTGQKGLTDFLNDKDFVLYDTEYFFMGAPTERALDIFEVSKENVPLSTGATAWFGFKKGQWQDHATEFYEYRREFKLIQTDVVCVPRRHLEEFQKTMKLVGSV